MSQAGPKPRRNALPTWLSWPDRVAVFVERLVPLPRWQKRTRTRRAARALLAVHARVSAEAPDLRGADLYERIVARYAQLDAKASAALVLHAAESFADWPVDRSVTFRDVVQYLIVERELRRSTDDDDVRETVIDVVATIVPEDL